MMSRLDKDVNRLVGRAIEKYCLIDADDQILIGVSGGKDSLCLSLLLWERLAFIPVRYHLTACFIDPGFEPSPTPAIAEFFHRLDIPFVGIKTDYGLKAHSQENHENPCYLCARLRRRRLFQQAEEMGCRKIALGHNKDDIIETLFINIFYAGSISTMIPRQEFFSGKLTVIRPLALVTEDQIQRWNRQKGVEPVPNPCPSAGRSRRQTVKDMLAELYRTNPKIKGNIFNAMQNVKLDYLL
ncbi:MAG: tRNA 2-thiocytidine(32) synthetase TtcA [Deltaproteobacteria bacterium]|nr:tRNA 2-thiocytidine(32) synthetase TtcA [Deltaproteobacteria bacterium]